MDELCKLGEDAEELYRSVEDRIELCELDGMLER